jgi:uncharacterized protein
MEAQQTPGGGGPPPTPGWYPDPSQPGAQRWWDGTQWTEQTQAPQQAVAGPVGAYGVSQNSRQLAMFAHLSAILTGFLGPLIFYLVKKDEDPFVGDQSREALNFNLTVLIAVFVCIVLSFLVIGLFILPIVLIGALVFQIIAGVQANQGELYRYPISIRMVT